MREILFRGKQAHQGKDAEWMHGYLVRGRWYEDDTLLTAILPEGVTFYPRCEIECYETVYATTVGQFTGITDVDGKRIFEGDIVEFESHGYIPDTQRGVVFFHKGAWHIKYVSDFDLRYGHEYVSTHRIGKTSHWQDMGASGEITYTYRLLGNIHDNRDLLDQKEYLILANSDEDDMEEEE